MLQVRVHGPGDVRVDDVPEPEPGPADVVVRVAACGICGSDLSYIRMGGVAGPSRHPMRLGHEVAGTVTAMGDGVDCFAIGDAGESVFAASATSGFGSAGRLPGNERPSGDFGRKCRMPASIGIRAHSGVMSAPMIPITRSIRAASPDFKIALTA